MGRSPRPSDVRRPDAELAAERAVEVPRRDGESPSEAADALLVHDARGDEIERPSHEVAGDVPLGRIRALLRAATPAGAEPGLLGVRGGLVEADDLAPRHRDRTDRTAVDPGRRDADVDAPVPPCIAACHRLIRGLEVGRIEREHAESVGATPRHVQRIPDLKATRTTGTRRRAMAVPMPSSARRRSCRARRPRGDRSSPSRRRGTRR